MESSNLVTPPLPRSRQAQLLSEHRYLEALAVWDEEVQKNEDDWIAWYERGCALRCLGSLGEALESFLQADERAKLGRKALHPYLKDIGAAQWMLGRRQEGIQTFRHAVDGILDGSIQYTDFAGGVSQGVLLWYSGVTIHDRETKEFALSYLAGITSNEANLHLWPRPLALHALGEMTFQEMLESAAGSWDLVQCLLAARTDRLKQRQLCQALFYEAIRLRAEGDEQGCRGRMRQCADLEILIVENEWYLARFELNDPWYSAPSNSR